MKSGYIYIVTSYKFKHTYKIGRWKNSNEKLIARYKTPYGVVINDLFKETSDYILAERFTHKLLDKYRCGTSELFEGPVELFKCVANNVCEHVDNHIILSIDDVNMYKHIITSINNANTDEHFKKLQLEFNDVHTNPILNKNTQIIRNITSDYQCVKCKKTFNHYGHYKRHLNRKTSCTEKTKYQCVRCNKSFTHKTKYTLHINRKFPCKKVIDEMEKMKLKNKVLKLEKQILEIQLKQYKQT